MDKNVDGDFSLFVAEHKTVTTHGAAHNGIPADIMLMYENYLIVGRNLEKISATNNDYI